MSVTHPDLTLRDTDWITSATATKLVTEHQHLNRWLDLAAAPLYPEYERNKAMLRAVWEELQRRKAADVERELPLRRYA
jgi:hypothetical protein